MAGTVSPGQTLTPNPNVNAPAGIGGSLWGANGGGITAVGTAKPVAATLCTGETAANYAPTLAGPVLGQENIGALSGQSLDTAVASGGTNAG